MEKPVPAKPELIEGYAHLCFDDQGLWFRGILLTTDGQSSYTLSGKRTRIELNQSKTTVRILFAIFRRHYAHPFTDQRK